MVDQTMFSMDGAPYFNREVRQMLIEGSHGIIPAEPIAVGNRPQLLMDKHVVDTTWNLFRRVHQPTKHRANPLIPGGEITADGFKAQTNWGTIIDDAEMGMLRFWTARWDTTRQKGNLSRVQTYWESSDGIKWEAPELGLVDIDGSTANNVIRGVRGINYGHGSVVEVPERLWSRGRYAMVHGRVYAKDNIPVGYPHGMQDCISWSDDGIHWEEQPENPIFAGRNDTFVNMVYNPHRDVFMQYRRATINAHEIRRIAYTESTDLINWTQPEVILDADELDAPMLYDFAVMRYGDMYLGMLHPLYTANAGYGGETRLHRYGHVDKHGQTDVELCWSRDGKTWDRHPERPIFIENGPYAKDTMYDWGLIYVCQGIVEREGQLFIYYRGDGSLHLNMPGTLGNFCLATLRKDGFVSLGTLGFTDSPGYMLTRPLHCPGGKLRINARTEPGGSVRAAVRRADGVHDGKWIDGWDFPDCIAFEGDSTDATLTWNERSDFDGLRDDSIRIHFWLDAAELYSFRFE